MKLIFFADISEIQAKPVVNLLHAPLAYFMDNNSLVILDFPTGWNFGLDMFQWTVGERFRGVSQIPNGVHFVYYSGPNDQHRQSFFVSLVSAEVVVRKWDSSTESLTSVSDEEAAIMKAASRDFSFISGMAPFERCMEASLVEAWEEGSSFVSSEIIARIQPVNSPFQSSNQQGDGPTIFWSRIPKLSVPPHASPSDISKLHLDRTTHLVQFLKHYSAGREIEMALGELQCAFILFLLGQNHDAFLHWRTLLELFLGCTEEGIGEFPFLFSQFLSAIPFQLNQLPVDLLTDPILSSDKSNPIFLLPLLSAFLGACQDASLRDELGLVENAGKVVQCLDARFGMNWRTCSSDDPVQVV